LTLTISSIKARVSTPAVTGLEERSSEKSGEGRRGERGEEKSEEWSEEE
jgi:hypothetical protein